MSITAQKIYSVGEAANYLGVSISTLRRWDNENILSPLRTPGGQRRYKEEDLREFLSDGQETDGQETKPAPALIKFTELPSFSTPPEPSKTYPNLLTSFKNSTLKYGVPAIILLFILSSLGIVAGEYLPGISVPRPSFKLPELSLKIPFFSTSEEKESSSTSEVALDDSSGVEVREEKHTHPFEKIALTSDYLSSLDASNLTGKIYDADHLDGISSSSFLRSDESDSARGAINFTAQPGGLGVGGGPVYVNPAASTANYTLFGVAVDNQLRFKVDAEGDVTASGSLNIAGHFTPSTDNTYDLGSSNLRWRTGYFATSVVVGGSTTIRTNSITFSETDPSLIIGNTGTLSFTDGSNTLLSIADAGTTGNLTVSGDAAINGGDITTTATTFNLVNATATTVNLAGAATTLSVGAGTGTTTINNNTSLSGTLAVTGNTTLTGDLAVNGGDITTTATTWNFDVGNTGSILFRDGTNTLLTIADAGTTGNVTVSGTLTSSGAFTASSTSTLAGDITFSAATPNIAINNAETLTITDGTNTLLTLADAGTTGNLTVSGTLTSSGAFTASSTSTLAGDITFSAATPNIAINNTETLTVTDGTNTLFTLADAGTTGNLTVSGNVTVSGNLTITGLTVADGDVNLGNAASDTITFVGVVDSNIVADANNTRNLGSASVRWNTGYFTNVDATTLSGTVSGGSTTAATWTVNSDNATANAEIGSLAFETGTATFNSVLQWNALGDAGRVSGYDDDFLFNYPVSIFSQVSGGSQTFTSGSLFNYGQNATHAITQSGAFVGLDVDFSSNITVPNTASGNQTGALVTLKDGGASATSIGFQTAGTLDYGLDIGGTIGTAEIRLSNAETIANTTDGTVAITAATTSLSGDLAISGGNITTALTLDSTLAVTGTLTANGASTFNTDVDFSLAASENVTLTNTSASADQLSLSVSGVTTTGVDGLAIAFTQADDADATDTNAALQIDLTSSSGDADTLYAINIGNLTAGAATEYAINIGTGWDRGISLGANSIVGTTADLDFTNFDVTGSTGNITTAGDLTVTGGDITLGTTSIFSGGDTASLNNIDALDATTETTVEAAIDTLANLTSAAALATVGTITTGVWTGTSIADANVDNDITLTSTKRITTTLTTEQLRLAYDASNYLSATVGSTGAVTLDATGAGAAFTVSDNLTLSGTLTANGAATFNTDVDLTLASTENLAITNTTQGAADLVSISPTWTGDNTADALSITTTYNVSASTGTVYGLNLTNADNTTNTGVIDALALFSNDQATETLADGVIIRHNAASGTLTDALQIENTTAGGTITNAINILETAGTITTGINLGAGLTTGIDAGANIIVNIGNAGTDFSSLGGLTLADDLTVTGGDITLGTTSIFSGGDTASLNNIDAIDATTETTIEAAIDTLANLTSAAALATVGTITTGVWTGTSIADANVDNDITITSTKQLKTTLTTAQLSLNYDASNYVTATVGSTGAVTLDATGAGAAFTISDNLTLSGTLTANGAATFNTDVDLTFAGTENVALTSDLAGSVDLISITGTPSGTVGTTRGLSITQANHATNTNGLDTALLIDNADADLALTTAISITNTGGGGYTNFLDTPSIDISGTGVVSGATGLTSSGTITFSGLTASRFVVTDASSNLAASAASSVLLNTLTDETGTGVAVFGTSPAITTSLTTPSTTFALVNTTATTVNFAGAATSLNLGAAAGTLTFAGSTITASSSTLALGGAVTGATTITASGNINTTGGALQTNSVTRIDNSGNATLVAITGTGNLTIGTDALFVNATTKRVGVGTASPTGTLHVLRAQAAADTAGDDIILTAQQGGADGGDPGTLGGAGGNITFTPGAGPTGAAQGELIFYDDAGAEVLRID